MSGKEIELKKIGETDFRELFHKIVYIQPTEDVRSNLVKNMWFRAKGSGFLAYGYIDNQAGFSFRLICSANQRNGLLTCGEFHKETEYIIRRGYINDCCFLDTAFLGLDESDYDKDIREYIHAIDECYKCSDESEEMRKLTFLAPLRSPDFPDDIQVLLYKEGMHTEQVWVRCYAFTDNELFGLLLNEPHQNFGVHNGSIIGFAPVKTDDGLLCVYTGRWLEEQSE